MTTNGIGKELPGLIDKLPYLNKNASTVSEDGCWLSYSYSFSNTGGMVVSNHTLSSISLRVTILREDRSELYKILLF